MLLLSLKNCVRLHNSSDTYHYRHNLHVTMAHNFQPANEVFRLFELVAIIVPHLDELSMVRVQRVNRTFREVVQGTRTL